MKLIFNKTEIDKFFDILSRMDRHVAKYYDYEGSYDSCQKSVFVRRTIGKLYGKLYKLIVNEDTGWTIGGKQCKLPIIQYVSIAKPHYNLGHGDVITVNYQMPYTSKMRSFEFDRWNIGEMIGDEITSKQYNEIGNLFKVEKK